jgi:hypothetical protein
LVPRPRLHLIRFQAPPHRIGWARLLKRVFDIDMQHCPTSFE